MSKWAIMLQNKVIKEFEIHEGERLIIGRGDDANVRIDNTAISRHHAALEMQNGKPFLQDLCSLNGSMVNGNKIDFIQLSEGDEVMLSKFSLVRGDDFEGKQRVSTSALPMDLEDATIFAPGKPKAKKEEKTPGQNVFHLKVLSGSATPSTVPLAGRTSIKIGKADNSDIITPGFFISANQCFINKREDGYHIMPQSGFIKTMLNGQVLKSPKKLHPGDIISIRSHQIRFEQIT
ncbi:MAG: FHA domain-containing protein [Proteobacteria bacterium]|nr:FHA domain-containing protein [Pseudomonadota bacterium]MBU1641252.1 FHA domain-containing protein [Pseudomonadota bacterium]